MNKEKQASRRHSGMSFSNQSRAKGKGRGKLPRAHLHGERQLPWAGSPTALGPVHRGYVSALPPSLLAQFGLLLCWTWGPVYALAPSTCGPSVWPRLGRAADNTSKDSRRKEKTRPFGIGIEDLTELQATPVRISEEKRRKNEALWHWY